MNKKYFNALATTITAAMLLMISGCKKYLDQQPITEYDASVVFHDVPSTYKALAGVYSRLVGDAGFGIRLSLYYTVDNDEMQGPTGAADNDRRDIARFSATSSNAQITNPFNQLFQGIEYANNCIDNIPQMDMYNNGTEQERKQLRRMYGEALTLRAQFYLEAIMNWGDLPAHFKSAALLAQETPFPFRTSSDTLYDQLLVDLKQAEDLVPWKGELAAIGDNIDERITKGTVKGLRARVALFRGGYSLRLKSKVVERRPDYLTYYQIARDECLDIMNSGQHSLNPSYKSLWKDQVCGHAVADPNGELMFQASAIGLTSAEDTKLGYYNGPTVNSLGNKSINVLPNYFYLFDSTDLRRDVTCAAYNVAANGSTKIGQAITAICDGKYRRDWVTNPVISPSSAVQYLGLKWQILRYSDVMLMFAEAENELNGPTAAAMEAVNQVRRRGYGKPITTPDATVDLSGLSKAGLFAAIVRERSLELGGEGVRKFDLIRWNLLGAAINESRANMIRMSTLTAMVDPTYMAGMPSYCKSTTLPISMYYFTTTTSDNNNIGGIWSNSLYKTAPTSTPAGTTKVTWLSVAINAAGTNSPVGRYATGYTANKSELLPIPQPARDANINLAQNPGY